jgi:hypothetical protein
MVIFSASLLFAMNVVAINYTRSVERTDSSPVAMHVAIYNAKGCQPHVFFTGLLLAQPVGKAERWLAVHQTRPLACTD